jgi:8-oxo-dGTP pyrophosphatase MutT (NUDIX family)
MTAAVAGGRDAATVILLRDGPDGPAVWLLRRVAEMAFAAGMSVFPGGGVDPVDSIAAADENQVHIADVAEAFGVDVAQAAMMLRAATRETLEEADVDLPLTALTPWSRWRPPPGRAPADRHYDTYFFVAALPAGAVASSVTTEAVGSEWVSTRQALEQFRSGDRPMLPPTYFTLCELAEYETVDAVLAAAPDRDRGPRSSTITAGEDGRVRITHGDLEWLGALGRPG